MKRFINNVLLGLIILLGLPFMVKAAPSAPVVSAVGEDLYYVKSSSDAVSFRAGTTTSASSSYAASNGVSYISLPNGNFYVWAVDSGGNYSTGTAISVTDSCSNLSVADATGAGTTERCFIVTKEGSQAVSTSEVMASCASGYSFALGPSYVTSNNCGKKSFVGLGITARYCKRTYRYQCVKSTTVLNSKLSALGISTGSLTPNFSADVATYTASTSDSSVTVSATLGSTDATFADGYGPRTVSLNYGLNNIYVKTNISGGNGSSYLIKLTRADSRNSNNYLSSLGIDGISISPSFDSKTVRYTATVDDNVTSVNINAALQNSSASFVDGYGPRTVNIGNGNNRVTIKVKSETGKIRVYTIVISKSGSGDDATDTPTDTPASTSGALLDSLSLSSGTIAFDPATFDYNVSVDYDVTNVIVSATAKDTEDTITVSGGDNLEVGNLNEITVTVTNKDNTASNVYTIYVERKEENITISSNSLLQDLSIDGYKIKFDAKTTDYSITLKEGATQLKINAVPSDSNSSITVEGNENLASGSEIKVRVTAEDGSYTDYFINIKGVKKSGNVILTIFVVILIILVLGYLVLRAMGYRINFNVTAIKDYFKKVFSKNK